MCVIFDSPRCNGANYHSHTWHSTHKTGICIISPYPTPRDLRGRCLYCFNYSGKPGISPVWCVCPVAWSKTYACPRLKVLTNVHTTHTHTHTHTHTTVTDRLNNPKMLERLLKKSSLKWSACFSPCFLESFVAHVWDTPYIQCVHDFFLH